MTLPQWAGLGVFLITLALFIYQIASGAAEHG